MNFNIFYHFGRYLTLLANAFSRPEKFSMYWKETVRQMDEIGVGSLIIVALISVFMGAVAAIQFAYQLDGQLIPLYYIGYIVRDLAIIETAPTITCLVLAGKVGSNIAAEIGGMRQKEHIDAMEIMGVNTAAYLVTPKSSSRFICDTSPGNNFYFRGDMGGAPGYRSLWAFDL
jgi:phospholipid/cholesterol/gamma-HCH transport system permease protein